MSWYKKDFTVLGLVISIDTAWTSVQYNHLLDFDLQNKDLAISSSPCFTCDFKPFQKGI